MAHLNTEIFRYWLEGAMRTADGMRRGLSEPYPLDEEPRGATPFDVVWQGEIMRLRRYRPQRRVYATPLLIVYALIKRPFILDLLPARSVIESLIGHGFEIYLTDWIPPGRADAWRGFDDYVNCALYQAVREVRRLNGAGQINLLGYCQGGLLALIWTALYPETVSNLALLGTPFDADVSHPLFTLVRRLPERTVQTVIELHGNCPAHLVNALFSAIAPVHHALAKYLDLYKNKSSRGYLEFFAMFEKWMNSDVAMAGGVFRELVEQVFRRNLLNSGCFQVGGEKLDFTQIRCPLLNLVGEYDDVVPPTSSLPIGDRTASRDSHQWVFPAGHVGMVVSASAHAQLWPRVGNWLAERDAPSRGRLGAAADRAPPG